MLYRKFFFIFSVIFIVLLCGMMMNEASAAPADRMQFHLDDGFIGRPIQMDVFDGRLRVSWGVGDLRAPTDLSLEMVNATTVQILLADPKAWSAHGVRLGWKGLVPSSAWDDPVLEQYVGSSTWQSIPFTQENGFLSVAVTSSSMLLRQSIAPRGLRIGTASWYRYKSCRCAASPDFPKGTRLRVSRVDDSRRSVIVRVNDFGPDRKIFPDRVIDLDRVAFAEIGNPRGGVMRVRVEPLPPVDLTTSTTSTVAVSSR